MPNNVLADKLKALEIRAHKCGRLPEVRNRFASLTPRVADNPFVVEKPTAIFVHTWSEKAYEKRWRQMYDGWCSVLQRASGDDGVVKEVKNILGIDSRKTQSHVRAAQDQPTAQPKKKRKLEQAGGNGNRNEIAAPHRR